MCVRSCPSASTARERERERGGRGGGVEIVMWIGDWSLKSMRDKEVVSVSVSVWCVRVYA